MNEPPGTQRSQSKSKCFFVALVADEFLPQRHRRTIMNRAAQVAAVGFAMAATDGSPLRPGLQPSPANYVCYVPAYIGFAHLIRRAPFLQDGGYRDVFTRHGEEKECCLR